MKLLAAALRPYLITAVLLAHILVLIRIYSARLHSVYRWFTVYICYEAVRVAVMGMIPLATKMYGYAFFFTQPVLWCLYLLVILELYRLTLRNHPGIASFARKTVMAALVISSLASIAALAFESGGANFNILQTYNLAERLILSSLLVLLLVFTGFLAYFPVPVNRNLVVHTRIFACYFLFKTALLVFRNVVSEDYLYSLNILMQVLSTITLMAEALLLTRQGETVKALTSRRSDPEVEGRLIAQLDAINRTLLSSAKK